MVITLPWPPTVNTYYTIARNRKILSKKGRKYKQDAFILILGQLPRGFHEYRSSVSLYIRAYPPDKRKRDLDNILKPVLDSLTLGGVYEDDAQVEDLRIIRFNPCKPGRVEIDISQA